MLMNLRIGLENLIDFEKPLPTKCLLCSAPNRRLPKDYGCSYGCSKCLLLHSMELEAFLFAGHFIYYSKEYNRIGIFKKGNHKETVETIEGCVISKTQIGKIEKLALLC